ncbi:hypothetical protein [Micromonospora sp. SH-82]
MEITVGVRSSESRDLRTAAEGAPSGRRELDIKALTCMADVEGSRQ